MLYLYILIGKKGRWFVVVIIVKFINKVRRRRFIVIIDFFESMDIFG